MGLEISLLGQRIRLARQSQRVSVVELAERVGITPESLGHVERGIRKPSLNTLFLIADELDVSLDYLTGRLQSFSGDDLSDAQKQLLTELMDTVIPIVKRIKEI